MKGKKEKAKVLAAGLLILAVAIAAFILFSAPKPNDIHILGEVHKHADFKIYVNGKEMNFSQARYMSSETRKLSNFVHLHDMDGEVIHQHIKGFVLEDFFQSIGMVFNSTCFVDDENNSFCNSQSGRLRMFVNGKENDRYGKYEFEDLDRILITYGNEDNVEIEKQVESVGNRACIPSGKCPERGVPGNESSCTVGKDCVA